MPAQQSHVFAIGFPGDIEHVPHNWNGSHRDIDGDVPDHAGNEPPRRAKLSSFANQPDREGAGDEIADSGNQPDDRIQTKLNVGSGDQELTVHQLGDLSELFDPRMPGRIGNQFGDNWTRFHGKRPSFASVTMTVMFDSRWLVLAGHYAE